MWQDQDQQPFAGPPSESVSSAVYDVAHQSVLRPAARFFAMAPAGESVNVNALDEVPSSSWFTNRASIRDFTVAEIVRAECGAPLDPEHGRWVVKGGKPNGANPGFLIEDGEERRFLLKFDGLEQPERATTGDMIGSRLYWAAGFTTPCNTVVVFDPDILQLDPEGEVKEYGKPVPLAQRHAEKALEKAIRLPDGRVRAGASLFLPNKAIGPWTYQGLRDDDPNDVVPHEARRELRASRLMAAWLGHVDSREQNTLRTWVPTSGGRGWVRHALIDFGDCFGGEWDWDALNRRIGHAYYLDLSQIVTDTLTFGVVKRPWDDRRWASAGRTLGYFDVLHFAPEGWRPVYPNPAFSVMTESDGAWMARIIANIPEAALDELVREAHVSDPVLEGELLRILKGRRRKLLRRYLSKLSPLGRAELTGARLCLRDHAVHTGVSKRPKYRAQAWVGRRLLKPTTQPQLSHGGNGRLCLQVPRVAATPTKPGYVIVEISSPPTAVLRVHFYDLGLDGLQLVGLERRFSDGDPT